MIRVLVLPLAAAFVLLTGRPAEAQTYDQTLPRLRNVDPGTRVRVTAPFVLREPTAGDLESVSSDAIRLVDTTSTFVVPIDRIQKFEISEGERSNIGKGVLWGTLVGAGIGLAVGLASGPSDPCHPASFYCTEYSRGQVAAAGAFAGAFIGAGLGLILGAVSRTERWRELPLDEP